ncbi:hypothetical protein ACFQHV_09075 [Promicromonospora thailandica]|uniref:Restriction endonuclease n=1 Tax=Promicromonospora thailandica TaxID=765201 RepID=A0A9X2GC98_9MICO|nr:hypothetical protein [Promicromonospora thailandica]MCP2266516.1 Restriction endonuclease [Promicromonospora thailandica]BFF17417.1 hypothetical protein GCM10025730_09380 [Promicromonospora thailandica]
MTALEDLLDDYMFRSDSESDRNEKFEDLMKAFLRTDEECTAAYDAVWSWDEWPAHQGPGSGIDLVAREEGTARLVAVRCAFHDPATPLSAAEVGPFLAVSNKAPFSARIVLATTDTWNADLEHSIRDAKIPVERIGLTEMLHSSVDWTRLVPQAVATAG